jgi:Protein of unknown function (DUF1593)
MLPSPLAFVVVGLASVCLLSALPAVSQAQPRVWITSDISDPSQAGAEDPDDVVSMAALLLTAHRVNIRGISTDVTTKPTGCTGFNLVKYELTRAYEREAPNLRAHDSRYPSSIASRVRQGPCGSTYDPHDSYANLTSLHQSTQKLVNAITNGRLYVLSWGALTEAAIAVKHLQSTGQAALLETRLVVVSHGTSAASSYNRQLDPGAWSFLKSQAEAGRLAFYDIGDLNRSFDSCPPPMAASVLHSEIGAYMNAVWRSGYPDFSDGSTFLYLLGYGGGLGAIPRQSGWYYRAGGGRALCGSRSQWVSAIEQAADWAQSQ